MFIKKWILLLLGKKYLKNRTSVTKGIAVNGRVSVDVDTEKFQVLSERIEKKFALQKDGNIIMDEVGDQGFQRYTLGYYKINIGWDTWYPFNILSETVASDRLVEKIYEWLHTIDIPK